jgi:hypothetical protein
MFCWQYYTIIIHNNNTRLLLTLTSTELDEGQLGVITVSFHSRFHFLIAVVIAIVLVVCICCGCFVFTVFVNLLVVCSLYFSFFVYFTCCVLLNVFILSVVLL